MEQDDPDLPRIDVVEALRRRADEIVQLGDGLDAREAAARHDECEQRAARFGRRLGVGLLERLDRAITQRERVAQILEREGVLGEPGLAGEARHVAERDHQVVVVELELARAEARRGDNPPALQVDPLHRPRVEVRAGAQAPDRRDRIQKTDAAGDHLREHRLERQIVLLADQRDLGLSPVPQKLLERDGGVDPAKAAADDHDPRPIFRHFQAPRRDRGRQLARRRAVSSSVRAPRSVTPPK